MIIEFIQHESSSLIILFVCLFLSGFFSSAETAITSLGFLKTKHIMDSGGHKLAICYILYIYYECSVVVVTITPSL